MKILYEFKHEETNSYLFVIAESEQQARILASDYTGVDYSHSDCIDDEIRVCDDEEIRITERIVSN